MDKSLSVIIPAYNEQDNIYGTLENVSKALKMSGITDFEILVIDDGSKDKTTQIVKNAEFQFSGLRLIQNPKNMGFGATYREGVKAAKKDFTVMVHGDNAWGYETLADLFSRLGDSQVVIGYTMDMLKYRSFFRTVISKSFTFVVNQITRFKLRYYNGLQIHPTETLKKMEIVSIGYSFQPEVLIKSLMQNKEFIEIGMILTERKKGESKAFKLKNIIEVLKSFVYLFKLRWGGTHPSLRFDKANSRPR